MTDFSPLRVVRPQDKHVRPPTLFVLKSIKSMGWLRSRTNMSVLLFDLCFS